MLFIRVGSRKLLPGAGQSEGGDIIAAVEAGQFPFPAFLIQLQNLGIGSAAALLLGDQVMIIGHGGDLGQVGSALLCEILEREGMPLPNHRDCGLMLYDRQSQQVKAGGSGCGCSASVLCGHLLGRLERGELQRLLFCGTGALLSPLSTQQGESVPAVCHAISVERG